MCTTHSCVRFSPSIQQSGKINRNPSGGILQSLFWPLLLLFMGCTQMSLMTDRDCLKGREQHYSTDIMKEKKSITLGPNRDMYRVS